MPSSLQIYDPRERALVRLVDTTLAPLAWFRRRPAPTTIARILLLRLERIGDLLMTLDAIAEARARWPDAEIDLAVGRWNLAVARLIPGITRVEVATAPWLARNGRDDGWGALLSQTNTWRGRHYDLVINLEPDIRTNVLAWMTRAPRRVGYWTGGGGALLTDAMPYDAKTHASTNAVIAIRRAAGSNDTTPPAPAPWPRLAVPDEAAARARALVGSARRPLVGIHASGGRESKQWHIDRFAAVARALWTTKGATILLTGSIHDRPLIDRVRADLGDTPVIDAGGLLDLPALAALLADLDLFITGDTGPMHVAAAMGTPVVALFGPSNPVRYGPRAQNEAILRVDLPCSPCGQVRLPPERCRGHVPECLDRIGVEEVVTAAVRLLDRDDARDSTRDSDRVASARNRARERS